jgi:hypothetical protein
MSSERILICSDGSASAESYAAVTSGIDIRLLEQQSLSGALARAERSS